MKLLNHEDITINTIGLGSIRLAAESTLSSFEVTAFVINDTKSFECTTMKKDEGS
jgi:hypothetical protein